MCNVKPGPRCSDHAYAKLVSIKKRIRKARNEIRELDVVISESDDKESALRTRVELKESLAKMIEELDYRTLLYDSTPGGQKNLGKLIKSERDAQERARLEKRLILGARLRRKQTHAMKVVNAGKKALSEARAEYKGNLKEYLSSYKKTGRDLLAINKEWEELSPKVKKHAKSYTQFLREIVELKDEIESNLYNSYISAGLYPKNSLDYARESFKGFIREFVKAGDVRIPILGTVVIPRVFDNEEFKEIALKVDDLKEKIRLYNVAAIQYKQLHEKYIEVSRQKQEAQKTFSLEKQRYDRERVSYEHFIGSKIRGLPLDNSFDKTRTLRSQLTPNARLYILMDYQGTKIFMKADEYATIKSKDFVFLESGERLAVKEIPLDNIKILP